MNTTQQETHALQAIDAPQAQSIGATSLVLEGGSMDRMMRLAEVMASSRSTIPQHLRGNVGDCMAVVMQATQWNMNPFAVAQKTHLVNGTLGYEAQLVAAVINNSRVVLDRFHFEWFGKWEKIVGKFKTVESRTKKDDDGNPKKFIVPDWKPEDEQGLGVKVWATLRGETEPRELTILMTQARTRNSTLWTEDPRQQIAYLAEKRWARLFAPDVILGVYTPDDIVEQAPKDMGHAEIIHPEIPDDLLTASRAAAAQGMPAYQKFWSDAGAANRKLLAGEHEANKQTAANIDKGRTIDAGQPAPKPASAPAAEIVVTFEGVKEKLASANNLDALFVAADWISEIDDAGQRAELVAMFEERQAAFGG